MKIRMIVLTSVFNNLLLKEFLFCHGRCVGRYLPAKQKKIIVIIYTCIGECKKNGVETFSTTSHISGTLKT